MHRLDLAAGRELDVEQHPRAEVRAQRRLREVGHQQLALRQRRLAGADVGDRPAVPFGRGLERDQQARLRGHRLTVAQNRRETPLAHFVFDAVGERMVEHAVEAVVGDGAVGRDAHVGVHQQLGGRRSDGTRGEWREAGERQHPNDGAITRRCHRSSPKVGAGYASGRRPVTTPLHNRGRRCTCTAVSDSRSSSCWLP